jgi:hypothetical protein
MKNFREVPIPVQMSRLDRDHRGYPIPAIVLRDRQGKAHFAANDEATRMQVIANDCCSICGLALQRGRWFIGGPLSAFHEHGAYLDPPLHRDCMRYAAQVCPYLALPRYLSRIEDKLKQVLELDGIITAIDKTQIAEKPDLFVAVMARDQKISRLNEGGYLKPTRPYIRVEFWKDGEQLEPQQGKMLCEEIVGKTLPELHPVVINTGAKALDRMMGRA